MASVNEAVKATVQSKYSKDGEFKEPVVICDKCGKVILVSDLHKNGMCGNCGNTRVRNVMVLNDENMATVKKWAEEGKIDPEWLTLFGSDGVDA